MIARNVQAGATPSDAVSVAAQANRGQRHWGVEVMIASALVMMMLCNTAAVQYVGYKAGIPLVMLVAGALVVLMNQGNRRVELPWNRIAFGICLVSLVALAAGDAATYVPSVGVRGAFITFLIGFGTLAFFVLVPSYVGVRSVSSALAAVCLGIGWFAWMNLLASVVGFGDDRLAAREVLYTSWYDSDRTRWQSALISGGTLSGMGRFALPMLLLFLWHTRRGKWLWKAAFAVAAMGVAIVLVRTESRNAAIPLLGLAVWTMASRPISRALVAASFCVYTVVVPFLWTNQAFISLLEQQTPEIVIRALGNQNFEDMLTLTGRTDIWADGVAYLESGSLLFVGTGQSALSSADYSPAAGDALAMFDPSIVPRLDFHQGFLDLSFIVGLVPACLLVGTLGLLVLKACARERSSKRLGTENSVAILSMGMIALSNAHDGYLSGTTLFFFLAGYAAVWIAGTRPAAQTAAGKAPARPGTPPAIDLPIPSLKSPT